jgi:hypothetical protein
MGVTHEIGGWEMFGIFRKKPKKFLSLHGMMDRVVESRALVTGTSKKGLPTSFFVSSYTGPEGKYTMRFSVFCDRKSVYIGSDLVKAVRIYNDLI